MKTQADMFYNAHNRIAKENNHFMELINNKINPLTKSDLTKLVERFPERWKRFAGFINKLK